MMGTFRFKNPIVHAMQFIGPYDTRVSETKQFCEGFILEFTEDHGFQLKTSTGDIWLNYGDWVVKEKTGMVLVLTDVEFRARYEPLMVSGNMLTYYMEDLDHEGTKV
jgi:hypothetical protein